MRYGFPILLSQGLGPHARGREAERVAQSAALPSLPQSGLVTVMRITARESAPCSSHAVREMEMVQSLGTGLMGQEPGVTGYSEGWGKPRQLGGLARGRLNVGCMFRSTVHLHPMSVNPETVTLRDGCLSPQ